MSWAADAESAREKAETRTAAATRARITLLQSAAARRRETLDRGKIPPLKRAFVVALAVLSLAPAAHASDRIGVNGSDVHLAVSRDGARAMVSFRAQGKT